jgi:hypothetical protein
LSDLPKPNVHGKLADERVEESSAAPISCGVQRSRGDVSVFRSGGDPSRPVARRMAAARERRRGARIRIFAYSGERKAAIGKFLPGTGERFTEGGETFTDGGGMFTDVGGGFRDVGEKSADGGGGFTDGGKSFDDGGTESFVRRGASDGRAPGSIPPPRDRGKTAVPLLRGKRRTPSQASCGRAALLRFPGCALSPVPTWVTEALELAGERCRVGPARGAALAGA